MDPIVVVVLLVFGLLLVGSVLGIAIHIRRSAKRAEALVEFAKGLGLTPVAPEELVRGQRAGEAAVWDAAGTAIGLAPGNRGQVTNLFEGRRDGRDLWVFDFSYSRVPGSRALRVTVVSLAVHIELPRFWLNPEGGMDRLIASLGGQDIDFPANPTFSRLYSLRADDEAAVRALFSPSLLSYFAGRSTRNTASVGNRLVCYSVAGVDGRAPVKDVASLVDGAVEVAGQLGA